SPAAPRSSSPGPSRLARPDEIALLEKDPAFEFGLLDVPVSADLAGDLSEEVRRRPLALAVSERVAEEEEELPVCADRRPGEKGPLELLDASLDVGERAFLLCERGGRQHDVAGADESVGLTSQSRDEPRATQRGDLRRGGGDRREGGAADDADFGRRLAGEDGVQAVAVLAGRETHVPGAAEVCGGLVALDPAVDGLDLARPRLVHDDVAVGTGHVVRDLAEEEILFVGEIRRTEEEEA